MLNRTAPRFKRQKTNYRAHTKGFVSFALFQIKCDRGSSHTCYIPQKCLHMGKTHTPYNTALDQETPVLKWHKSWSPKLIPTSPGRIGLQLCQGHLDTHSIAQHWCCSQTTGCWTVTGWVLWFGPWTLEEKASTLWVFVWLHI